MAVLHVKQCRSGESGRVRRLRWSGESGRVRRLDGQVSQVGSGGSMVRTGESEVSQVSQVAVRVPILIFGTSLCKKRAKPS